MNACPSHLFSHFLQFFQITNTFKYSKQNTASWWNRMRTVYRIFKPVPMPCIFQKRLEVSLHCTFQQIFIHRLLFPVRKTSFHFLRRYICNKKRLLTKQPQIFPILFIYGSQKRTAPRFPAPNGFRSPARYMSCALPSPGTPPEPAAPPVPHPLRSRHDR